MSGKKLFEEDYIQMVTDPEGYLKGMDKLIAAIEKHRERFPSVTDEDLADAKAAADDLREELESNKREPTSLQKAGADGEPAEYELELQRHITRRAQIVLGEALKTKKPRFDD